MNFQWQTGVANVVSSAGRMVTVQCPHCNKTHIHGKDVVGSKQVVAGCHLGYRVCRMYAVVDTRKRGKRRERRNS